LRLAGVPAQADVDRLLSVYETWVHVDVARPESAPLAAVALERAAPAATETEVAS
jgi:hypothetical protein